LFGPKLLQRQNHLLQIHPRKHILSIDRISIGQAKAKIPQQKIPLPPYPIQDIGTRDVSRGSTLLDQLKLIRSFSNQRSEAPFSARFGRACTVPGSLDKPLNAEIFFIIAFS
jgi:hypothetical protein